jgi:site-specific recombinase XerD
MTNEVIVRQPTELVPVSDRPASLNPALVYLAGLNTSTGRSTMRQALETTASLASGGRCTVETMPWHALRFQHTQAIRARLAEMHKPATVNKMLSALRGTLKAAWKLGQMSAEDYQRAVDIKSIRGETLPAGRELTPGEIAAILDTCAQDPGPAGVRDAAIFSLLYAGGLRRSEVVALDLMSYDPDTGQLKVHGKGRKERIVWINNGAKDALSDWLTIRPQDPEHDSEGGGPLFFPILKSGRIVAGDRLTEQAIYNMLKKRAKEAGVKDFSPHDLRRTFVSDLLDAGADIATVQKMAGHANVTTTARYDRRPEEAKRKAAGLLHVPYRRRRMM